MSRPALVVIDIQNDYFPGGAFPLHNADATLNHIERAIALATVHGIPVILVQHVADPAKGPAPFFNADTVGVALHPRLLAAAPTAPVVVKRFADAFHQTTLAATLSDRGVDSLWLCGMMTQNCVTHTALSPAAAGYAVSVLGDACATVSDILHRIALSALTTRLPVTTVDAVLPAGD